MCVLTNYVEPLQTAIRVQEAQPTSQTASESVHKPGGQMGRVVWGLKVAEGGGTLAKSNCPASVPLITSLFERAPGRGAARRHQWLRRDRTPPPPGRGGGGETWERGAMSTGGNAYRFCNTFDKPRGFFNECDFKS